MNKNLKLGVLGIDHGHIFGMLDEMIKEGCACEYWWTDGSPLTLQKFLKKYPNINRVNDKSKIVITNLNPSKRPISAVADNQEVRNAKQIIVKTNNGEFKSKIMIE